MLKSISLRTGAVAVGLVMMLGTAVAQTSGSASNPPSTPSPTPPSAKNMPAAPAAQAQCQQNYAQGSAAYNSCVDMQKEKKEDPAVGYTAPKKNDGN